MATEPTPEQVAELAAAPDEPIVMLNLNRYKDRAAYHESYGEVAVRALERVGGRVLWFSAADQTVIGDDGDRYDEVIAVQYPSPSAFLAFTQDAEVAAALAGRRDALEKAVIVRCNQAPQNA